MSAMAQSTCAVAPHMSAFGGKADIWLESAPVRYGPAVSSGVPMDPRNPQNAGSVAFRKPLKRPVAVSPSRGRGFPFK